jgi:pimeloyl-ACP methyl ester carboxylesterase/predicted glycosyltransferase
MRARQPDLEGCAERDGVKISYEVHGDGETTLVLVPPWAIVHARTWKMQIPYLARHYRVVAYDPRGNGLSDRPAGAEAHVLAERAADLLAVMDATDTERAVLVSLSLGASASLAVAAEHPDRVQGVVFINPATLMSPFTEARLEWIFRFDDELDTDDGWAKENAGYWQRDFRGYLEFFFSQMFPEPHSTKQIEDGVMWALDTTPELLADTRRAIALDYAVDMSALCQRVRCPSLVIQGSDDKIVGGGSGAALAAALGDGSTLVELEGSGHGSHSRDPVKVNSLIRDFVDALTPGRLPTAPRWRTGHSRRRRRVLYVSSPIGLGHARRDVTIAAELRKLQPDVEIDWLAQHPVTTILEEHGERVHPASSLLANESAHIEHECGDHDLHCFQAWRRMDEILHANFMVFRDVVEAEPYDLWIGDEAWELDYYLHENPEEKRAAYAWITDFVGWLPMADGGEREATLTADYNAEMIDHIARFPRVRDRSVFVGAPEDLVPDAFGAQLPGIRAWTEEHFEFSGDYITGFAPDDLGDRAQLRADLGYHPDEQVCIVTVGGSGVGAALLRRLIESFPLAKAAIPALRMVVVAGPRIDPTSLPPADGLDVRAYVPDLFRHLAACDLAVVQGGLTTTMELTANQRPFLYFPLGHHFEQMVHVPHRLARYGAGRRMDYTTSTADVIATAIADEIQRTTTYRPLDAGAAARVATSLAELL